MVAAPDLGSGGESRGGSSPPIRTFDSEFRIMNYEYRVVGYNLFLFESQLFADSNFKF